VTDPRLPAQPENTPAPDDPQEPIIYEVVPERHLLPEFPDQPDQEEKPVTKAPPATNEKPRRQRPQFVEETTTEETALDDLAAPLPKQGKPARVRSPLAPPSKSLPISTKAELAKSQPASQNGNPPREKSTKSGRPPRYRLITLVSAIRSVVLTFSAAVTVSTIFMWWTSPDFLTTQTRLDLAPVQATQVRASRATPTALPTPIWFNRIGIVAGHSGPNRAGQADPGAICPDGFNELSVTTAVADRVVALLRGRGFTVDLLGEWDQRRLGYQAAAYISLHADSCEDFGYGGFKSTSPAERQTVLEQDNRLNECVRQNYASITGLEFLPGNITPNMLFYHHWKDIAPTTPAVILELGFLSYDRDLLQNQTDKVANAIVNGLLCYFAPPQ
jgi:N-acetylmuramoyl-L-alanine amidase